MKNLMGSRKIAAGLLGLLLVALFVAVAPNDVQAVPANPHPFYFTQQDGDEIMLFFRGDEFFAWWEDENGFVVTFDEQSGNWRYAYVANNLIVPSGQNVGAFDATAGFERTTRAEILPLIANGWRFDPGNPALEFLNGRVFRDHRAQISANLPIIPTILQPGQVLTPPVIPGITNVIEPAGGGQQGGDAGPGVQPPVIPDQPGSGPDQIVRTGPIGGGVTANAGFAVHAAAGMSPVAHIQANQRLLVVLVEFDNMPLLRDQAFYNNKYFNTAPGAVSVANYFRDMSGGRNIFVPAGSVNAGGTVNAQVPGSNVGWAASGVDVTITPSAHSGIVHARLHMDHPVSAWTSPAGHEAVQAAVSVALAAIHSSSDFDFAGVHVAAVVAGGEASDNYNPGGQVWAHAWQFQGAVAGQPGWPRYMAYGERQRGGHVMGIGIAVHELGHVLGLPDLYDLSGQSEGLGPYSLMAFGSWGRGPQDAAAGHRPTALDPWSRIQLGYIEPIIIREGSWRGNVNSANVSGNNVLLVTSPAGDTQYFLIENRQMESKWDAGLSQWISNPNAPGGIMIFHVDDSLRSANPADMTRNNNNRHHKMVGLREADGSELLVNAVARWGATQDHFFSADSYSTFNAVTNPNSNFHGGGGRNAPTGIEIIVHSNRGDVMEVEVILAQSGGAAGPIIGVGGGGGNAPAQQAGGTATRADASLNHARIQNQVALNASIPTLTLVPGVTEILMYGRTLELLVNGGFDLAVNASNRSTVLPAAFLSEILGAGDANTSFNIIITDMGDGVNISIMGDGQHLLERNI